MTGRATSLYVRTPNWLGDTVMALPALAALRAGLPDARITVVGRWALLLRGQGVADVALDYPRTAAARRRLTRVLRADPPDMAVLLPNSFEAALAAWRWGARRRIGFDTDGRQPLLSDRPSLPSPRRHQVDEYLLLVESVGISASAAPPTFRAPADAAGEREVAELVASLAIAPGARLIGLHAGAAGGSAKQWEVAGFARLADRLAKSGLIPVLLGGPEDSARAAGIAAAARSAPASLVGRDRPALLPHLLARLSCLVSGDTGVAHLAAALGIPTVTLFGPTDPHRTAPRSPSGRVLAGPAPCAPCFLSTCPIDHPCLRSVTARQVEDLVLEAVGA